ncbi:MAG: PHP domain-containing protein [Candidatus Aenigmarchaeota archaeon]|nr:PHP domain-containing protein [Candidatus Aenigmarchaeota archaeon]MDW8149677.1 PHP domain-containing protein [Candidatus Aenigmarchaeota archaeon]
MNGIFHLHTVYSKGSSIKIEYLVKFIKNRKIDGICITDHSSFKGYEKIKKLVKIDVVPGIEIDTNFGDVIIIGIEELKNRVYNYNDLVDFVKNNGGLVVLPHPFDIFRKGVLTKNKEVYFDVLEIFNGRCILDTFNEKSKMFCKMKNKIGIAGSDAHFAAELDNCYLTYENDFFESIKKGKFKNIINKKSKLVYSILTLIEKL